MRDACRRREPHAGECGDDAWGNNRLQPSLPCSVGYFFSYIQLAAWWAAMGDVGGRHLGALFGLCNRIGLSGGALSPLFLGQFADHRKALGFEGRAQWDPAFPLSGGVRVAGGLRWLFVNPQRSVRESGTQGVLPP